MGYNILIVDDSKTVRAVLRRTLGLIDISTDSIHDAENGQLALEILGENPIDIVLTDVHMPVMSGVELLKRMQADERFGKVARVVITSDATKERQNQLRELGIHSILNKPFQAEDIRDAVVAAVEGISHE